MQPADQASSLGPDGLTHDELRRSRARWWDDAFTHLLTDEIPDDTTLLLDVGCGLGVAAGALHSARPALRYVGLDLDADRLAEARASADSLTCFVR